MNPDTESRLRAALHRRADSVTSDRLTQSFDTVGQAGGGAGPHPPAGRSRSWILPAAVAVVVAAAATGIGVASRHQTGQPTSTVTVTTTPTPSESASAGVIPVPETTAPSAPSSPSPTPTATATPSATSKPSPAKLGPITPVEQPKSAVPWGSVGPGWAVAGWSSVTPTQDSIKATGTLYLVSPSGTRYAMAKGPYTSHFLDVTADGRRVLADGFDSTVVEWDLAAGTSRTITVGPHVDVAYTKPDGHALLVTSRDAAGVRMQRLGMDGSVQLTFPNPGLQTPDGMAVIAATDDGLAVYGNATGTLVRTMAYPAGYRGCDIKGWWPDGRAELNCVKDMLNDLFLYPVDGAAPTQLTAVSATTTPAGLGFTRAWPVSNGVVAEELVGCGTGPLLRLTSPSTSASIPLQLPTGLGSDPSYPIINTVVGDVGYFDVSVEDCSGGIHAWALMASDLVSGRSGVLLGPGANGGTVGGVIVIGSSRMSPGP